ncbi:hypothetical protein [Nocardiopsis alborubida]|uniref:PH domain-containing protein n=1 Tax=Nocardiopsis alborubida TaxID=146802 RepID=A0A7X6RQL0_9ACTN|nr:hypothetical protein [Nocardiopsis alborubida]NKY98347.1 hypothetical protein [Nocardiopsis alborubida]
MSTAAVVSLSVALAGCAVAFGSELWLIARKRRIGVWANLSALVRDTLTASVMPWSLVRFWVGLGVVLVVSLAFAETGAWMAPTMMGIVGAYRSKRSLDYHRRGLGPDGRSDPRGEGRPRSRPVVLRSWWGMLGGVLLALPLLVLTLQFGRVRLPDEGFFQPLLLMLGVLAAVIALPAVGGWLLGRSLFVYVRLDGTHVVTRGGGDLVVIPVERITGVSAERGLLIHTDDGGAYPAFSLFGSRSGRWTNGEADRRRAERVVRYVDRVRPDVPEMPRNLPQEVRRQVLVSPGGAWGAGALWLALALHVTESLVH